jgi:hypothetical protein
VRTEVTANSESATLPQTWQNAACIFSMHPCCPHRCAKLVATTEQRKASDGSSESERASLSGEF